MASRPSAPRRKAPAPPASAARRPPPPERPGTIRWDRVGRTALLGVLGVIVLLYGAPISHYITQSRTAGEHRAELQRTEAEHARLKTRVGRLSRADAVEEEARRLGMVRRGERAFVIQAPKR